MSGEISTEESVDTGAIAPQSDVSASPTEPAPVETQAAESGSEAESSPAASPDGDETSAAPSGEPELMTRKEQERWNEVTRQRGEAERRAKAAERQNERLLEMLQNQQAPPEPLNPEPEVAKTLADFNYDEGAFYQYLSARAQKDAESAASAAMEKYQSEQAAEARRNKFSEREREFAKTHNDYVEVAHHAPISDAVASMVMEVDDGPELAYHLGKNPDLAETISRLPERLGAIELGRIAGKLEAARNRPKPVTGAPPPPPQLSGDGDPGDDSKDPLKMTDAQFAKWREKQIAARR